MEMTKIVNVFNKTPRQIRCIKNEIDYLGDGSIITENLIVGNIYTLIKASKESYGDVVYLKEVPSRMGILSCMFEEMIEYDIEIIRDKSQEWLKSVLDEGEKQIEDGKVLDVEKAFEHIRKQLHDSNSEWNRGRNPDRISDFLSELQKVWQKYPDLRFGQLVSFIENDETKRFYLEDDMMLEKIRELERR